jgi:DNA-binding transcriptional LysR family regulator
VKLPQINVQQLISFYFVAKEKSFSVASEKLFVTQPAVTQQIKALEAQFGVKLINVKRKRTYLTKAGERLFGYTEEVISHLTLAENFLKSYRVNNLQIGVASTLTLYLTPVIDKFKELYPSVKVAVRDGPSLKLIEALLDFNLDICLVGTLREINKRLQVLRIPQVEQMVLVANPEYPIFEKSGLKWKDLVNYPLIIQSEGSIARERILEHFRSRNLTPLIGAEVDNVECAKELARQKKGVALMFLPNIKEELALRKLKIVPVTDGEIKIGIDIARNQEMAPSPLSNAFISVIEKHFAYRLSRETPLASII